MKKNIFATLTLILASAFALTGCGGDDTPTPDPGPTKGTATRPAEWLSWQDNLSSPVYLPTSMTYIVDNQSIEFLPDSQDLIAAFVGSECRGCAKPESTLLTDSTAVFLLCVHLTEADSDGAVNVTYRYYSHNGSKIYTYGPQAFVTDGKFGTPNDPVHFAWQSQE